MTGVFEPLPNMRVHDGGNPPNMREQVWMDDYKRLFYMHRPDLLNSDIGSVTNRLKFKQVRSKASIDNS